MTEIFTNIIIKCQSCTREFRISTEIDGTIKNNHCPHCAKPNQIPFRMVNPNNMKDMLIPFGVSNIEAKQLNQLGIAKNVESNIDGRLKAFVDNITASKIEFPIIETIRKKYTIYIQMYNKPGKYEDIVEYVEIPEALEDIFFKKYTAMDPNYLGGDITLFGLKVRLRKDITTVQIVAENKKTKTIVRGPI